MYNRGLKRYKRQRNPHKSRRHRNNPATFRRNVTMSDYEGVPAGFSSIPAARAFLLRHHDICKKHFNVTIKEPATDDTELLRLIDNAARLIKKADRRNYRRQIKSAARKIYETQKFISDDGRPLLSTRPTREENAAYTILKDAIKSLSAAIKKSLEVEASRRKAERRVKGYFSNTEVGPELPPGEDRPTVGLPPKIAIIINRLFDKRAKELRDRPTALMETGSHRVKVSDQSSATHAALPDGPETIDEDIEDVFEDAFEYSFPTSPGEQLDLGGGSPWGRTSPAIQKPKSRPQHSWEWVSGTKGKTIVFHVTRFARKKTIKKVAQVTQPQYENGDIVLDMRQGVRALQLAVDPYGNIDEKEIKITDDMQARYEGSYLYVVRKLAEDGNHRSFLAAVDARKKGKYRYSKKMKKRRKR